MPNKGAIQLGAAAPAIQCQRSVHVQIYKGYAAFALAFGAFAEALAFPEAWAALEALASSASVPLGGVLVLSLIAGTSEKGAASGSVRANAPDPCKAFMPSSYAACCCKLSFDFLGAMDL